MSAAERTSHRSRTDDLKEAIHDHVRRNPQGSYERLGVEFSGRESNRAVALCPLHDEKTPSFKVNLEGRERGRWWCFGACSAGGDVFDFVQKRDGLAFGDAKRHLSDVFGIGPKPTRPREKAPTAADVEKLHKCLLACPEALDKLHTSRLLTDETIQRAKIGAIEGEKRYAVPVYSADGEVADIRRISAGGANPKCLPWRKGLGGVRIYDPWRVLSEDGANVLIHCEGEFDCLVLNQEGFPAYTTTNGAGKWPKTPPDLTGRIVVLCGDNDDAGRKHNSQLPAELYAAGAEQVRVMQWPENAPKGYDPTDFFRDSGDATAFRQLVEAAVDVAEEAQSESDEVEDIAADLCNERGTPIPPRVAEHLKRSHSFISLGGELHRYHLGVYLPDGEETVRRTTAQLLGERYSQKVAAEAVGYLRDLHTCSPTEVDTDLDTLNVANGLLNVRRLELRSHTPDYVSVVQVPHRYDPDAECPTIDRFFGEIVGDECRELLYRLCGYALRLDLKPTTCFLLLGDGANGKSTFTSLLRRLAGAGNCAAVSLRDMGTSQFAAAGLFGKLINIHADVSVLPMGDSTPFKALTGDDEIRADVKYKKELKFVSRCKQIFAANSMPVSKDTTHGWQRRWIVIPFRNRFDGRKADPNMLSRLCTEAELAGLLARSLQAVSKNDFTDNSDLPEVIKEATAWFVSDKSYSARRFLAECCDVVLIDALRSNTSTKRTANGRRNCC